MSFLHQIYSKKNFVKANRPETSIVYLFYYHFVYFIFILFISYARTDELDEFMLWKMQLTLK